MTGFGIGLQIISILIFKRDFEKHFRELHALRLATAEQTEFLKHATYSLYQVDFSADGRWITFEAVTRPGHSRLFVAPASEPWPIDEKNWVPVTDDRGWDDKPRWSPDGNLIYFTSERDGFVCLWAQRLDPGSKKPIGAPLDIYHFHGARRSMMNVGYATLEISVAPDKIILNLGEFTGNVWMTKLEDKC